MPGELEKTGKIAPSTRPPLPGPEVPEAPERTRKREEKPEKPEQPKQAAPRTSEAGPPVPATSPSGDRL